MKGRVRAAVLPTMAWIGLAMWLGGTAQASGEPKPKPTVTPTTVPDPLSQPLAERIAGKRPIEDVRIDVDWVRDSTPVSARIYGDGVGIWQKRLQFVLTKSDIVAILEALRDARFGAMAGSFGSDMEGEEEGPIRLKGRIVLRVGRQVKRVAQYGDGEQSPGFAALAEKILAICAGPASKGKGTSSLSAGLRSLAENELFPQTLSLIVQRAEVAETNDSRWILRVDGRTATDREVLAGRKPPDPRRLVLSEADFRALVKVLAAKPVESFPANLYAPVYTDLRIGVLNHSRSVTARRFLDVTPETHGDDQKAFDRVLDALRKLHERVKRDGKAFEETEIGPGPAEHERESEKEREEEREKARRNAPDPLAGPLEDRIRFKDTSEYVIDVSWPTSPDILAHCRIYGDGVGLWYGSKQFRVDQSQVLDLMNTTRRVRFGAFPSRVGGEEDGDREIQGRISVTVGDLRQVVLVLGEKPDEELEKLARAVLEVGTKAEKRGITIQSLSEGIDKISSGILAPQTLEVVAQQATPAVPSPASVENWVFIASGHRVRDREVARGKVAASERVLRLSDTDFRSLLAVLKESRASELPRNIYGEKYSRLRVQILNQIVTVEARRFSGMDPATQSEARARFDRVWQWCVEQRSRVLASGREVSLSMPGSSVIPGDPD